MTPTNTATETGVAGLTADHEITECDTPDGPWYRVAKVNRASVVLMLDNDDPTAGTIRIPMGVGHVVLARRAQS